MTQAELNQLETELQAVKEALQSNLLEHKRLLERATQLTNQLGGAFECH
jgi:hypothetical protein